MRKAIKLCLALAMVGTMATTVYAGDKEYSLYGRVRTTFSQTTTKTGGGDAASSMDMEADGRIGHTVSDKGDVWTASAASHFEVGESGLGSTRDLYVQLAKDDLEIRFGRYYPTDVYAWSDYAGPEDVAWDIGSGLEGRGWIDRFTALRVKLPEVGLAVDLGINFMGSAQANETTYTVDATGDVTGATALAGDGTYTQTDIHARFDKSMGDLSFGVSYHSRTTSVDEKNGGVKDGTYDGAAASSIGIAAKFVMGEMAFLGGIDSNARKMKDADGDTQLITQFGFDMGLGDGAGIGVTVLSVAAEDKDADTKTNTLNYSVGYSQPLGGATLYLGANSKSEKEDDADDADTGQGIYARLYYGF